jgi:hypothetical protein
MHSLRSYPPVLLLLIFLSSIAYRYADGQQPKPTLSSLSSTELQACYDDLKRCGAGSIYEILDEFERRLPTLPTDLLLACFDDWKICGTGEGPASGWPISDELARRGNITPLLARFWTEPKLEIRDGIEHVAYHFDTPEALAFMQKVFVAKKKDGENLYWPTNYLAKKCDPAALKELSTGRYRNQGCTQYQTSVALFGKCSYRPAVPYLIDAVDDFCGNIGDAAVDDLQILFPNSPKDFNSLDKAKHYFCARAKQEHYPVRCDAKKSPTDSSDK